MHRGYIKLYRKSEENPLYFADTFTKWQAWSDLILIANHSQKTLSIRGNLIKINRGQTAYSEESLAQRWKWSRGKVRRFINYLKTEQQIEQQQSNILNILTIKNYNIYHDNSTADSTTDGQQTVQQTDTNKNVNNNKNVKNINIPEWIPRETWDAFIEVRKAKKCPNTERALKMIVTKLDKFKSQGISLKEVMELSIVNGWKDVYEPRKGEFIKGGNKAENLMNQNIQAGKDFITQMKKESEGLF